MMTLREKKPESKRVRKIAREEMTDEQRIAFLKNPRVSIEFLVDRCLEDSSLFHVIASELYVLVEGRLVRNKPQYFINSNDKPELSRYALLHAKDCMINSLFIESYKTEGAVAFRSNGCEDEVELVGPKKFNSNNGETNGVRNQLRFAEKVGIRSLYGVSVDLDSIVEQAVEEYKSSYECFLPTFSQEVCRIMCEKKIDVHEFVESTNLTPNIYSRIKTQPDYIPTYRNAVAICFGLKLDLSHTEQLLKIAGYAFRNAPETAIYRIFWSIRHFNITDLNNCLVSHGCEPIGSKNKAV